MPSRLPLRVSQLASSLTTPTSTSISAFLVPFLHSSSRQASILASLSDTTESYSRKIRRGRGPSSGKGKTSGRGHKGQKQHGKVPVGFQGGQTSDEVVHGHEGFKNLHALEMTPVNLDKIQDWIESGRLDPSRPITLKELSSSRALHGIKDGVKLLARGATSLTTPIHIIVSRASAAAISAVEAAGGTVTTRFYTKTAIRRVKMGLTDPYISLKWDPDALGNPALVTDEKARDPTERVRGMGFEYRLPDPTGRKDIEYYRDANHRGYLAHTVKEGEGPSLYFKPPSERDSWKKGPRGAATKTRGISGRTTGCGRNTIRACVFAGALSRRYGTMLF